MALRRIASELSALRKDFPWDVEDSFEGNPFQWSLSVQFSGGLLASLRIGCLISFPTDYPFKRFQVSHLTSDLPPRIWIKFKSLVQSHPGAKTNYLLGMNCRSLDWSPTLTVAKVMSQFFYVIGLPAFQISPHRRSLVVVERPQIEELVRDIIVWRHPSFPSIQTELITAKYTELIWSAHLLRKKSPTILTPIQSFPSVPVDRSVTPQPIEITVKTPNGETRTVQMTTNQHVSDVRAIIYQQWKISDPFRVIHRSRAMTDDVCLATLAPPLLFHVVVRLYCSCYPFHTIDEMPLIFDPFQERFHLIPWPLFEETWNGLLQIEQAALSLKALCLFQIFKSNILEATPDISDLLLMC